MKFYDFYDKHSWRTLLVALCVALCMWYSVSVRDRIEAQFEIRLEFKGPPADLIVTSGLINKMTVRVQGPEALLRSVNTQNLVWVVNLSDIKKGTNIIPLVPKDWSPNFRAFEMVYINPSRLVVEAEPVVERTISLVPQIKSSFDKNIIKVDNIRLSPEFVVARGPESHIAELKNIAVPIRVDALAKQGSYRQDVLLDVPPLITTTPPSVAASYTITSARTVITLERAIVVDREEKGELDITPRTCTLRVEVPEQLANNNVYLRKVHLRISVPPLANNASLTVPLEVSLPPGMSLVAPLPETVTVTKGKK